jgi:hypothetical protein
MFNKKRINELEVRYVELKNRVVELEEDKIKGQIKEFINGVKQNYPDINIYYEFPVDYGFFANGSQYGIISIDFMSYRAGKTLQEMLDYVINNLEKELVYCLYGKEKMKKEAEELQNKKKK